MPGQLILSMDFAEDYIISHQDQPQNAYWDQDHVTIHPVFAAYKHKTSDALIKHSFICISDDNKHDHHAVHAFKSMVLKSLQDEGVNITAVVEFTDGAASQYKGKGAFADIAYSEKDFGFTVERVFSETSHGKGICDGLGAIVKHNTTRAVLQRQTVINGPYDMFKFAKEKLEDVGRSTYDSRSSLYQNSKRTFLWVPSSEIQRERPERMIKTVQGTRKLHAISSTGSLSKLKVRDLACFCENCTAKEYEQCMTLPYSGCWTEVDLKHQGRKPEGPASDYGTKGSDDKQVIISLLL